MDGTGRGKLRQTTARSLVAPQTVSSNSCVRTPCIAPRVGPAGRSAVLAAVALAVLAACGTAIPTPTSDLTSGQAFLDLGMQLVQLREDNAMLQSQIDSLRGDLAYQDSVLRQLAAGAGVPMRPPVVPFP